jgi:hypothetical protein
MRISWSTLTLLFSREMRLTACFRPAIVRWWLISVGMIADTTRRAADDDAYTLVENLAGMGTLVSAPSTLRYLELTYEAFKLAAEPGRRWRLPAGLGDDGAPRDARQIVTGLP